MYLVIIELPTNKTIWRAIVIGNTIYHLKNPWISSSVFPLVSGTHKATNATVKADTEA